MNTILRLVEVVPTAVMLASMEYGAVPVNVEPVSDPEFSVGVPLTAPAAQVAPPHTRAVLKIDVVVPPVKIGVIDVVPVGSDMHITPTTFNAVPLTLTHELVSPSPVPSTCEAPLPQM